MKKGVLGICFLVTLLCLGLFGPTVARAATFTDNFSGGLGNWTAGPSHIDSYGIQGGELFIDGYGHLTGPGGWGVLQFNQPIGSTFTATWDTRITYYKYANFVLFAGSPWDSNTSSGYARNGYLGWLDINDPDYPKIDVMKVSNGSTSSLPEASDVPLSPDIAINQRFNWRVEKSQETLKVYIDNALVISTHDSEFANSNFKLGLSFGEDSQGYIDNLTITTVPVPPSLLLLGPGFLGLAALRRRFKK